MLIQNPNIIFIHIGKTAGTSIENCIKNKYKCYNHSAIEQHSSIIDYQQRVNLDNYFKFVVVRNPYTRLWSQYNFQLIKDSTKKDPVMAN